MHLICNAKEYLLRDCLEKEEEGKDQRKRKISDYTV